MEEKFQPLTRPMPAPDVPRPGEASEFYFACRNGDIDKVKRMLPTIPYNQLNHLEANGSTPLHAATYYGHLEIVRLLLHEYGCIRHLRNRYGSTAYEEAQTDEMREFYHRPLNSNRFNDDSMSTEQLFEVFSSLKEKPVMEDNDDEDVTQPDRHFLIGFETSEEVKAQLNGLQGVKAFLQSRVGRHILAGAMKLKLCKDAVYGDEELLYVSSEKFRQDIVQTILDKHVTPNHPEYQYCCYLLKEYVQRGTIEPLLKLYTLETPFYQQLSILSSPLGFLFHIHLPELKPRYYQGYSYRGVRLSRQDLNEYRWALKNKDRALSSMTFASTSISKSVAERFATKPSTSLDKLNVLFVFYFPQPCDTAINLGRIPEYQLSCISNYENEQEVLVGPRTFFKVTAMEQDTFNERYTIHLECLYGEQMDVWKAFKFGIKYDLKMRTKKLRDYYAAHS